jgi:hypothetical protein
MGMIHHAYLSFRVQKILLRVRHSLLCLGNDILHLQRHIWLYTTHDERRKSWLTYVSNAIGGLLQILCEQLGGLLML